MRVNDTAMYNYVCSRPPDHQGELLHQPPKDSGRHKHFKLFGNLLFYFRPTSDSDKSSKNSGQSFGVFLIEKCRLDIVGAAGSKIFTVMFEGEGGRKHHFTARTGSECGQWVEVLRRASYSHLKSQVEQLRAQIVSITNKEPMLEIERAVLPRSLPSLKTQATTSNQITSRYQTAETLARSTQPVNSKKAKANSTFYTPGLVPGSKPPTEQAAVSKSKFFTELEVVKAEKSKTMSDANRSASSRVDEIRRKAMTAKREGKPGSRSAVYGDTPDWTISTNPGSSDSSARPRHAVNLVNINNDTEKQSDLLSSETFQRSAPPIPDRRGHHSFLGSVTAPDIPQRVLPLTTVPGSTGVSRTDPGSTGVTRTVPGSTGISRTVPGSTGVPRTVPGSTGVTRTVNGVVKTGQPLDLISWDHF